MKPHWLLGLALLPIAYLGSKWRNDPQFGAAAGAMKHTKERGSVAWKRGSFRRMVDKHAPDNARSGQRTLLRASVHRALRARVK